ncbi:hypothetical protein Tdes44962_MAKER07677 [Teratosphaeria destructans]|uniref:F-box domain-containing protein n=1 Tax=Teratosphaeria destructans TaxID=418781 RepID=A0A9W7SYW8_9PEZI|nr:hypothetical protein Tdes44962_MAKER07677 [Teratosphaeria destructans]
MALPPRLRAYLHRDPARLRLYRARRAAKKAIVKKRSRHTATIDVPQECNKSRAREDLQRAKTNANSSNSPLLRLPAELREAIFEYAVAEDNDIAIYEDLGPPEWLMAAKQVRHEALHLWYTVNKFEIVVSDLDGSVTCAWARHINNLDLGDLAHRPAPPTTLLLESYNWTNIVRWANVIWKADSSILPDPLDEPTPTQAALYTALWLAWDYSALSWEECEAALDRFRYSLAAQDGRWKASESDSNETAA